MQLGFCYRDKRCLGSKKKKEKHKTYLPTEGTEILLHHLNAVSQIKTFTYYNVYQRVW